MDETCAWVWATDRVAMGGLRVLEEVALTPPVIAVLGAGVLALAPGLARALRWLILGMAVARYDAEPLGADVLLAAGSHAYWLRSGATIALAQPARRRGQAALAG